MIVSNAQQATTPGLTRSSLHRCLLRHGISRLPEVNGDKPMQCLDKRVREIQGRSDTSNVEIKHLAYNMIKNDDIVSKKDRSAV